MRLLLAAATLVLAALTSPAQSERNPARPQNTPSSWPHATRDDRAAQALGWRLGVQAWTFRDRTCFEAIDTAAALGLKYIELYPGQVLRPEQRAAKVGPDLAPEQIAALKDKLQSGGVTPTNFGVVGLSKDKAADRKVYDFCKALGIATITAEPDDDAFDAVEALCQEYGIRVAIHDHPKPAHYWKPDIVLAAIAKRSPMIGLCADVGHWTRSGLDTIECLRQAKGRIVSLHWKDVKRDAHGIDVPSGEGDSHARAMLEELERQGFAGVFSIEYEEGKGKELEANVGKCIAFFDRVARELAREK